MSDQKNSKTEVLDLVKSIEEDKLDSQESHVIATILSIDGKEVEITDDVDYAMKLAGKSKNIKLDPELDRRVLRKIDIYLMPFIGFLYSLFLLDKSSNSYSSVMGITEDLHMVGNQYSWTGTAFYLGYLAYEPIASYSLQRFPLALTSSIYIISWGVILCLHATPNYAGLIALRTLLGAAEASASVFTTLLTSQYYKKEEQFLRVSIWLSSAGFGIILGSLIAYGIAIRADSYAIDSWRVMFIVIGLISLCVGIIFYFHVPNTPDQAWFLNEEEKLAVVERIRANQQGFGNRHFKKSQFIEALVDVKTWLFFVYAIAFNIPNGGLDTFGSLLLHGDMGFSSTQSLLYNAPKGAIELVGLIAIALLTQKFNWPRLGVTAIMLWISIAFACMLAFGTTKGVKLTGFYLLALMQLGPVGSFSYFSSNSSGHTKKITITMIYLIGYCIGNLVGPQTYKDTDAPHYTKAKITIVVCLCIAASCITAVYFICLFDNKRRDKRSEEGKYSEVRIKNIEFADLTDKQNPYFRYTL